jgi:alkanesulfonate monooxygenase SsuD/methylene tetrahydromethanopterin reductase-like flavin-dependent oxidoreductase (luciferase family)
VLDANQNRIQFGIRLANSGPLAASDAIFSLARRSASAGFDSVWVHDHMTWASDRISHFSAGTIEACDGQQPVFFESVTTAVAVGATLERTRVGIAGLALPLRDPRVLAKQLGSADTLLGGGRIILAIGVGSQQDDFRVMGVPWNRRGRISNDYLAALRAILDSDGPVSFTSDSVQFEQATFQPSGRGVEIWVAASSAAGLARAAKWGDGWLSGPASVENYASAAQDWRAAVETAGRDPESLRMAYEVFACVKETTKGALATAEASIVNMYGSLSDGLPRTLVGDPEVCIERLKALAALGAQSFEFRLISGSQSEMEDMVDLIAEEIVPAFR